MAARVRKPPSKQVPCRVMSKSVDNEEHSYVPDTDKFVKFDGVAGCKITQKNKCMGDYNYIYPMLDSDGVTRLVTDSDFHKRILHKYRSFEGYTYVYPVLTLGLYAGKRSDLIPAAKDAMSFVPEEVDRMIPQGVEQIMTHYDDRGMLLIASRRGDIYLAGTRRIPFKNAQNKPEDQNSKPNIKSVSELNEEAEPKPTKKQLKDIERWKKQMEELNRYGNNLSGNRIVHFGCEVNREEWRDDDDILSWFAENYPEDEEEDKKEGECNENGESKCVLVSSKSSSFDEDDSGYAERRNRTLLSSGTSVESITSDGKIELENDNNVPVDHGNEGVDVSGEFRCQNAKSGGSGSNPAQDQALGYIYIPDVIDNQFPVNNTPANYGDMSTSTPDSFEKTGCKRRLSSKRKLSTDHADSGKMKSPIIDPRNSIEINCEKDNKFSTNTEVCEPTSNNSNALAFKSNPESNNDYLENTDSDIHVQDQVSKNQEHELKCSDNSESYLKTILDKKQNYTDNFKNQFLSVDSQTQQTRQNSDSNSVKSDLFFDAEEAFVSDACSDGFLTPERDAFDVQQTFGPGNIAELVRSLSSLQDNLEYRDAPVLGFMDDLINRSEMECGRCIKKPLEKVQIPLM